MLIDIMQQKAKSEKDKTIHILHFTDLQNIRPIYYDKCWSCSRIRIREGIS